MNRQSARFYQFAFCSVCKSDEKLMVHKFTDDLMCQYCVGDLINKENEQAEADEAEIDRLVTGLGY